MRLLWHICILMLFTVGGSASWAQKENTLVRDAAGRIIRVHIPFTRIISLYGAHTENLKSLGLDMEVIGVCPMDDWGDKPVFSYHNGLEKFLAATPDLVLVRPMIDRAYPQLMEGLEKQGIIVVSLQPSSVEEMFDYWKVLGRLTGKDVQAEDMVRRFKAEISVIMTLTKAISQKKRVYFEAIHSRMKTFTHNSMAIFALEAAGGINIADDASSVRGTNIAYYGKERILSKADQIDVFLSQNGTMNQPTIPMIKNEPGFGVIKAVKNDRVYIVDEKIVSRPTMNLLKGVQVIGEILYPHLFENGGCE